MSDHNPIEIDLETLPQPLKIYIQEGGSPVVVCNVQEFLNQTFPDGDDFNGDPGIWGILLCDVIRHVTNAHHQVLTVLAENGRGPVPPGREALLNRLMNVLVDELESGSTVEGNTNVNPDGTPGSSGMN